MEVPMSLGQPLVPLQLEREQREQLEAMASSRSLPHGLVTRVRIVLLSADGLLPPALHTNLLFLAQPSGNLVQHHHAEGYLSRHLRQRQRTSRQNRTLRSSLNAEARPFSWTATPDSILEKIQRLCERISGTQH